MANASRKVNTGAIVARSRVNAAPKAIASRRVSVVLRVIAGRSRRMAQPVPAAATAVVSAIPVAVVLRGMAAAVIAVVAGVAPAAAAVARALPAPESD